MTFRIQSTPRSHRSVVAPRRDRAGALMSVWAVIADLDDSALLQCDGRAPPSGFLYCSFRWPSRLDVGFTSRRLVGSRRPGTSPGHIVSVPRPGLAIQEPPCVCAELSRRAQCRRGRRQPSDLRPRRGVKCRAIGPAALGCADANVTIRNSSAGEPLMMTDGASGSSGPPRPRANKLWQLGQNAAWGGA